jgi:NAD(P)-dependent dehydrogenase (short-subunit alcohol dehydrogenase family)
MQKTILITGATSGIGRVTALNLARNGAEVYFFARNPTSAAELVETFQQTNPKGNKGSLQFMTADLAALQSVQKACDDFIEKVGRLDVLYNNAGIWNFKRAVTRDGLEETFQVNLAVPVYLKERFKTLLSQSEDGRMIQTASALHRGTVNFDDSGFEKGYGIGLKAYQQSKLGLILLSRLWARDLKSSDIAAYSMHPGMVSTNIGRKGGFFVKALFNRFGITPEKAAETLTYLGEAPKEELTNGAYYIFHKPREHKASSYSKDLQIAEKLEQLALDCLSNFIG